MLSSGVTLSSALLLAGIVSAQTPVGFEPEVKDRLEIIFGSKVVETRGADFAVTREQVGQTLGFDLAAFIEKKVGLKAPPVRAGYFDCRW
ncbi:uncharacterized protein P884DRAFT_300719 [Thermothelomyces heterothallicus CBS 202.75]|uniref:uncharacterized protein n=1 Tax=Thermothelomyces heterothallicus CBS 202.75 TaxID=1149848 RepID=UPI003742ED06